MRLDATETAHLIVRPYTLSEADVTARHLLLQETFDPEARRAAKQRWAEWMTRNYEGLASIGQPPYGDYAIVLKATGENIGSVGLVPAIIPWALLLEDDPVKQHWLNSPEFGLFWAIRKAHRGKGYATEAAQVVISHVFEALHGQRVIADTEFDNLASQAVMRKLDMRLYRNETEHARWCQVVGVLHNPRLGKDVTVGAL